MTSSINNRFDPSGCKLPFTLNAPVRLVNRSFLDHSFWRRVLSVFSKAFDKGIINSAEMAAARMPEWLYSLSFSHPLCNGTKVMRSMPLRFSLLSFINAVILLHRIPDSANFPLYLKRWIRSLATPSYKHADQALSNEKLVRLHSTHNSPDERIDRPHRVQYGSGFFFIWLSQNAHIPVLFNASSGVLQVAQCRG